VNRWGIPKPPEANVDDVPGVVTPATRSVSLESQTRRQKFMHRAVSKLIAGFSLIAPITSSAQDAELSKLAWLAGCWAAERGDAGSGEQWTPLAGGTMLGVGRTVRDGKTVEYEFLQIRRNEDGKVVYIALPSGQAEASFTLTGAENRRRIDGTSG
jgi:hypothetical protein